MVREDFIRETKGAIVGYSRKVHIPELYMYTHIFCELYIKHDTNTQTPLPPADPRETTLYV